ncbi:hypothetical protein AURDEDRAFT_121543 [Auricularia subglabra TFB-10046 SS5]|nr:hypothetical protein AURDEDRAFT_121543 [Auricularia subglabra TFB-10046 SS5]
MAHPANNATYMTPRAPRMHTIPLPAVALSVAKKSEVIAPGIQRLAPERILSLRYDLAHPVPLAANDVLDAPIAIAARNAESFAVRGTPSFWKVTVQQGATLRDALAGIRAMLYWPMSYAELELSSQTFEHRSRVMKQCAQRCAAQGEVYKGAQSLRRIDWLLGATRLQAVERVHGTWVLRLSA